jgi:methionyl-tRNA formyltransferase
MNGETTTGLTTFFLQHEIDTGNVLRQIEIPILPEDNAGTLHDRMMYQGAGLVLGSVDLIASGNFSTTPQNNSSISHAAKIDHETGHLNWNLSVLKLHNLIRAMSPYPGAWTTLDGKELKVLKSRIEHSEGPFNAGRVAVRNNELVVQAKDGELVIEELQLMGKKRMRTAAFLNGYKIKDWQLT